MPSLTTTLNALPMLVARHLLTAATACLMAHAMATVGLAQTSCFPTCDSRDGRMLRLGGDGSSSIEIDTVDFRLSSPATDAFIEIGLFDGESAGHFDRGNQQLVATLYADPSGRGEDFSTELKRWTDVDMIDNGWTRFIVPNDPKARAANGTYLYTLRVYTVDRVGGRGWNGFKVRTDGRIGLACRQPFAAVVPLASTLDAGVIYPAGADSPESSTYDGTWNFFLHVPSAVESLTVWDADLDHGSDLNGDVDELSAFARPDRVWYEVVLPDGRSIENRAPSGAGSWKRFQLAVSDAYSEHPVDSLPGGVYEIIVHGMDVHNPGVFRFFDDGELQSGATVVGVDPRGQPVIPHGPYDVCGSIYYDDNANGVQDYDELGIPSVRLVLESDYDADGLVDATKRTVTDSRGRYSFAVARPAAHRVRVDTATLAVEVAATGDADGLQSDHEVILAGTAVDTGVRPMTFGYDRRDAADAYMIKRRAYWARHSTRWALTSVWVGTQCLSGTEALTVLRQPTRGDMTYALAAELISAKLNVADGFRTPCIDEITRRADQWMARYPVGCGVDAGSSHWQRQGAEILEQLESYNSSRPCPSLMN